MTRCHGPRALTGTVSTTDVQARILRLRIVGENHKTRALKRNEAVPHFLPPGISVFQVEFVIGLAAVQTEKYTFRALRPQSSVKQAAP